MEPLNHHFHGVQCFHPKNHIQGYLAVILLTAWYTTLDPLVKLAETAFEALDKRVSAVERRFMVIICDYGV